MATPQDYLQTAYENACKRLSEIDALADGLTIDDKARLSYTTDDGRSLDWNGYRQHLREQIAELPKLIAQAAGPWEFREVLR